MHTLRIDFETCTLFRYSMCICHIQSEGVSFASVHSMYTGEIYL